ncbi:hypothetical protein SDRG_11551 [Saprolegnia diclina VS20]|uniref:Orc1-like AAA ATPase domain-containing protein n=1 Tax=Saprolegnia diclina (strain VS20) TaxID=1156394 RepID=T0QB80_SAPDV|nr:hypothetical protein SDRG_11551 [Saprolegnia diclina VS20]EQC30790.1 hypothetical protein SDRG_11551 [Saprolegnia diclina VS20]|eukprot:XP_008615814.1 hypothetical protein SDRG_11551 [Saprolegnia diclina VS20]
MKRLTRKGSALNPAVAAPVVRIHEIDSISEYESEFHHAFMKSRLETDEFLYADKRNLLRELDEFCDVDGMHLPKGPLIVFGAPGSGKSAYLANWVHRRKKKFQNWNNGLPEFIFYHAVACTRQGAFVSKLLERILTELKEYFELPKEVPTLEERLSWQFPRYLDAASRKGRIILIVDGVHRLRTSDGDSILKWLPLSFPSNVRLVLAATSVPSGSTPEVNGPDLPTMERIKIEAVRRNWHTVHLSPLSDDEKRLIVAKFLQRQNQYSPTPGLQLFELQVKAIVSIERTTNPKFLRVLLVALAWAAKQGFNIHVVFKEWVSAMSNGNLYESILRSMEVGYTPSHHDTADAMQFLGEHALDTTFFPAPPTSPTKYSAAHATSEHHQVPGPGNNVEYDSDDDEMGTPRHYDEDAQDVSLIFKELSDDAKDDTADMDDDDKTLDAPREILTSVLSTVSCQPSTDGDELRDVAPKPDTPVHPKTPLASQRSMRAAPRLAPVYPVYVTGGRDVLGLRGLLGKALCVLYVARHGLLVNELKSLVNAMAIAEKEHIHGLPDENDDTRDLDSLLKESIPKLLPPKLAFQESTWSTLLSALRTLGFLFLQDIVLFPMCYDSLRDLVYWRYIGSPKAEMAYHNWLVRFFICHPPTFRRVEELPWHLTFCKRWFALKEVLVNLPMFQLLFTANYKTELFSYWKTLSEGSAVGGSVAPSSSDTVDNGDDQRKHHPVTFDVVREYNKSLDDWYHCARPTTKQLLPMELPTFNHPIFDLKELTANGFHFVPQLPHVLVQQSLEPNPFYLYHRWIWIQFPWLALGYEIDEADNKSSPGAITASISIDPSHLADESIELSPALGAASPASLVPASALAPSASAAALAPTNPVKRTSSMPNINKHPRRPTAVSISPFKLKAIANASLPTIPVSNAPATLDIIGPNSPTHLLMKRKTSFMGFKNAPTASFTVQLENTILEESGLGSSLGRSLSQRSPAATNAVRDVDFFADQMVGEGFGLQAHVQDYPKTEYDVKKSCNQQVLLKLQQCHNYLKREATAKNTRLEKLRQTIRDRKHKHSASLQYIHEAEDALREMTRRMDQVDATMKVVAKQEKTYVKLLKSCEVYPASDPHHLSKSKKEAKLLQMTLRDLNKELEALRFQQHHVSTNELPRLKIECAKNRRLHEAVLDRLEKTRDRMELDQAKIDDLYQTRLGIIEKVKAHALQIKSAETIELEKKLHVQVTAETTAYNKASIAKVALNQCQSMCRRIIAATGLSDMSAIHDKFNNREALNKSLDEQAQLYEARLKQIKMSQSELEAQVKGLEHIHKECADPRVLEDDAREAESSLLRVQRTYSSQLHALNEIVSGLANIARLAGITRVTAPKQGLVPARDLWPPYQDKDTRAVTLSQFESVSPEALCEIIRVCEERMMAVIDKNEHGRGDPDVLYGNKGSVAAELNSKPSLTPRGSTSSSQKKRKPDLRLLKAMSKRSPDMDDLGGDVVEADDCESPRPLTQSSLDVYSPRAHVSLDRDDESGPGSVITRETIKTASKHKLAVKRKETMGKSMAALLHHEDTSSSLP